MQGKGLARPAFRPKQSFGYSVIFSSCHLRVELCWKERYSSRSPGPPGPCACRLSVAYLVR